jgi:hypothetical protein
VQGVRPSIDDCLALYAALVAWFFADTIDDLEDSENTMQTDPVAIFVAQALGLT